MASFLVLLVLMFVGAFSVWVEVAGDSVELLIFLFEFFLLPPNFFEYFFVQMYFLFEVILLTLSPLIDFEYILLMHDHPQFFLNLSYKIFLLIFLPLGFCLWSFDIVLTPECGQLGAAFDFEGCAS